jgi:HEAT repeat protein
VFALSDDEADHYLVGLKQARDRRDVPTLVAALQNPRFAPRAVRFLAKINAVEAAPEIERLLSAPEPHIRSASATALGRLRARDAAKMVEQLARTDPIQWVRSYALVALARILGSGARPVIRTALTEDPDWRTRRAAAAALGLVGSLEDIDFLRDVARREPFRSRRRYRRARWKIRRRAWRSR